MKYCKKLFLTAPSWFLSFLKCFSMRIHFYDIVTKSGALIDQKSQSGHNSKDKMKTLIEEISRIIVALIGTSVLRWDCISYKQLNKTWFVQGLEYIRLKDMQQRTSSVNSKYLCKHEGEIELQAWSALLYVFIFLFIVNFSPPVC